jgi:hypothetical protein
VSALGQTDLLFNLQGQEEKQECDSKENDTTTEASVVVTGKNAHKQSTEGKFLLIF